MAEEGTTAPAELSVLYAGVRNAFRTAGLTTPDLDARILVTETLGVSTAQLIANPRRQVPGRLATELQRRVDARLAGQSIGRILGRRAFWSLDLRLSPETLEPRPETETVVELALSILSDADAPANIADLGVGTGAILLAILTERPNALGIGIDVCIPALVSAARNAERHGLEARTHFAAGNFGAPLAPVFDLVVSNPPYVATSEIATLSPSVREYDPHLALDGGADGLTCYRTVFSQAVSILRPGGTLIVEVDPRALADVVREAQMNGLTHAQTANDLTARPRAAAFVAH